MVKPCCCCCRCCCCCCVIFIFYFLVFDWFTTILLRGNGNFFNSFCETNLTKSQRLYFIFIETMPGIERQCGPCCVQQCKFPQLELCPLHKCINCKQVIHVLCGVYDESREEYRCPIDCWKVPAVEPTPTPHPPIIDAPTTSSTDNNSNPLKKTSFYYIGKSESEEEAKQRYKPVVDVAQANFEPIETIFKVHVKNHRGRTAEVEPTPEVLTKAFISKELVTKMVLASNQYRESCLRDYPNLSIWKRKNDSAPFTMKCMYQYLAILKVVNDWGG